MKLNPFEIGKMVNKALKNKDRYKERAEYLKDNPLKGESGSATAVDDIENNRMSKIVCEGVDENLIEEIRNSVNMAFDKADTVWSEFEN